MILIRRRRNKKKKEQHFITFFINKIKKKTKNIKKLNRLRAFYGFVLNFTIAENYVILAHPPPCKFWFIFFGRVGGILGFSQKRMSPYRDPDRDKSLTIPLGNIPLYKSQRLVGQSESLSLKLRKGLRGILQNFLTTFLFLFYLNQIFINLFFINILYINTIYHYP